MTNLESAQFLATVKLFYPAAYTNAREQTVEAAVKGWEMIFADIPYSFMNEALKRYMKKFKFPPTVADIGHELRHMYYAADDAYVIGQTIEDRAMMDRAMRVMEITAGFRDYGVIGSIGSGNEAARMMIGA